MLRGLLTTEEGLGTSTQTYQTLAAKQLTLLTVLKMSYVCSTQWKTDRQPDMLT